jgi:hypothetical protein
MRKIKENRERCRFNVIEKRYCERRVAETAMTKLPHQFKRIRLNLARST